jgi:hypothetical protein
VLDLRIKELFFDRAAVQKAVARGRLRALNRIGGFLRTTSRRGMRSKKGASPPGTPPHAHTKLLKDHLYFSYDQARDSVVIGPALLISREEDGRPVSGTVPQVLEQGGEIRVREVKRGRGWARARSKKAAQGKQTRLVKAEVKARPFMGPALETARKADKLSEFWKDVAR